MPQAAARGPCDSLRLLDASPVSSWSSPGAVSLLASSPSEEPSPAQERHTARESERLDSVGVHLYLVYYALTRGLVHAAMLEEMFNSETVLREILLAGPLILETVAAVLLAGSEGMTPGRAHLIGTGLDFGLIAGFMVGALAGASYAPESSTEGYLPLLPPLTLSLAGAVVGALLVDARHLTWGDVEFVHLSGLVGAFAGGAALGSLDRPDLGVLLGSAGGLLLGGLLVRGRDFSVGQSLAMDLITLVGGISGAVAAGRLGATSEMGALAGGAGAAVGLSVSYLLFAPFAASAKEEPPEVPPVELSLQLAPGSLSARGPRGGRPAPMSLLLHGRF